jgi:hypothetical protein
MIDNGFCYAFSMENKKYASMVKAGKKIEQKANNQIIKAIFRDNGKLNVIEIKKSELGNETLKHDDFITYYTPGKSYDELINKN